jgi:hypothetical protein
MLNLKQPGQVFTNSCLKLNITVLTTGENFSVEYSGFSTSKGLLMKLATISILCLPMGQGMHTYKQK